MQALNFNDYETSSVRSLSAEEIALIGGADGWSNAGIAFNAMGGSFVTVGGAVSLIPFGQIGGGITMGIGLTALAIGYTCNALSSD
jgi:hypothetical protein